jgi:hypothetical protein
MNCYQSGQRKVDELGRVFVCMGKVRKAYKILDKKLE